ncbi:MAG: hypothetical protein HUJ80_03845 [Firmicutes bacterium]|nr:hypothetical protein [Bacillota bacterium]
MALKRNSAESMFGVLTKDAAMTKEEPTALQPKKEEPKEPMKETAAKAIETEHAAASAETETSPARDLIPAETDAAEAAGQGEKEEAKAPAFIAKAHLEKKEIKSVRKQFVLTPSQAAWLKATAEAHEISENKVIELLIKNAAEEK